MRQHALWIPGLVVLCCFTGCGEKQVEVAGKVTWNGAVLNKPGGVIIFVADNGKPGVKADIGSDGTYRALGVPVGHNRVVVYYANSPAATGKKILGQATSIRQPAAVWLTPGKYTNVETSGLAVEVQTGTVYNVDMVGPAKP